jgi:hypothetical protein
MISLSDSQLKTVMIAASAIEPSRRDLFLQRCASMLRLRHRFTDQDVVDITQLAVVGLTHRLTAA